MSRFCRTLSAVKMPGTWNLTLMPLRMRWNGLRWVISSPVHTGYARWTG